MKSGADCSVAEEVDLGYIYKADQAHICIFVYLCIFVYFEIRCGVQCSRRGVAGSGKYLQSWPSHPCSRLNIFADDPENSSRQNISKCIFLARKISKILDFRVRCALYSKTKDPWSPFLWRWLMFGIRRYAHIFSPHQVTAQNFMPICHSCQAVCVTMHFRSGVQLGLMHYIAFVLVKQDKYIWCVLKRGSKIYPFRHCPRGV